MTENKKPRQRVRTVCTVEGLENCWIEYDVTDWGLGVYFDVYERLNVPQVVTFFIPRHSVAWHIENTDGVSVAHPGRSASKAIWASVWGQISVETGRKLRPWLTISVLTAIEEAMALESKSAGDDNGAGAGTQDDGDGSESDTTD